MEQKEILTTSRFYLEIDGMSDLVVKKVGGIKLTLDAAGDKKSFGVTKGGKSRMQATVSGVSSGVLNIEFVATLEDRSLHDWYRASHPEIGPMAGGISSNKGDRTKTASLTVYNQGGEESARWSFTGVFPKTYKTSKMEPGSTELFTEKVEIAYETCHRVQ